MLKSCIFVFMIKKISSWLRNKYVLSAFVFLLWITFIDQNNLITQYEYISTLNEIKTDRKFYLEEITKTKKELNELSTDQKALEKFAREKYLMKKDNEEIFVFEAEKK